MEQKVIFNIFLGLRGILYSTNLSLRKKIILCCDDFRFLFLLVLVFFFKRDIHKVRIHSFHYTVYFDNYITFYYIFNEIFCKEVYEPLKIRSYFDLGANIGLAILWYKFFNPGLSVTAFEPDAKNYKYLDKNIKINHLKGIQTYKVALSNKKGTARFYHIIDDIQSLDSGLRLNQKLPFRSYLVKTNSLSSYIHSKIDLVKIDIEGSEYEVFDDLFKSHKVKFIKHLIFEAHYFNELQKEKLKRILLTLKKIGKVESLENSNLTNVFSFRSRN